MARTKPASGKGGKTTVEEQQYMLADAMQFIEVLDLKLVDHSCCHEAIKTVQTALLQDRRLTGTYESSYEEFSR